MSRKRQAPGRQSRDGRRGGPARHWRLQTSATDRRCPKAGPAESPAAECCVAMSWEESLTVPRVWPKGHSSVIFGQRERRAALPGRCLVELGTAEKIGLRPMLCGAKGGRLHRGCQGTMCVGQWPAKAYAVSAYRGLGPCRARFGADTDAAARRRVRTANELPSAARSTRIGRACSLRQVHVVLLGLPDDWLLAIGTHGAVDGPALPGG